MSDAAGIFPPSTARYGPASQKRRDACKRLREQNGRNIMVRWDDARDADLMNHIAEGRSFRLTATLMGLTVGAVVGRFNRLREAMGAQAE